MAHTLGVNKTVGMLAFGRQLGAPVHVVAVVAHSPGIMLTVDVGTSRDFLPVPYRFGSRCSVILPKNQIFLQLIKVVFQIFGRPYYLKNRFYFWQLLGDLLGDLLVLEVNRYDVTDSCYPFYLR